MTILKVDEETFDLIIMALTECGYDVDELDLDLYEECPRCDLPSENQNLRPKKNKKNKICAD